MKKIVLTTALIILPLTAMAGKKFDSDKALDRMTSKLDLSAEQQTQVDGIKAEHKKASKALDEKYKIEAYKEERKALIKKTKDDIDKVLTKDQRGKLKGLKDKRDKKKAKAKGAVDSLLN